ncbi:hypothetical protein [Riemerella columbina]|uniref:hypothetical protein n=1 Tax=Riemerella columbina TaxID=103810 RepID=UPI00266FE6BB|nr:hypothetical protein [Riemerella columbina]WKS95135.1 hypothetical protein NYR17_09510 [Riemerella columbina]
MKLRSIFVLLIFLNFMALPSIAKVMDWEIPMANITVSEEETHTAPFSFSEKILPEQMSLKALFVHLEIEKAPRVSIHTEPAHRSPILSITTPPPEA